MNFDAVIIGAGPAGCAAGIQLAKNGLKTAIVEKSSFPRHKVCGEFFSPGSVEIWKKLGILDKIKQSGSVALKESSLYFPGQKKIVVSLTNGTRHAYALSRFSFDSLMLNHAKESGCEIFSETECIKINENADYCIVGAKSRTHSIELKTSYIIMAGGRTHRFQKKNSTQKKGKIGFKRHFKSSELPESLELYFFPGGYLGLVQIENREMNLCGILTHRSFEKYNGKFDALLKDIAEIHPKLKWRLEKSAPVTPWLSCMTPKDFRGQTSNRVLWAGDSAYFLEPMIGQGMTVALASGMLAANALISAKNPRDYFIKKSRKLLNSKTRVLNFLEPLGGISARIPKISRALARFILKPGLIRKILATPV